MKWIELKEKILKFGDGATANTIENLKELRSVEYSPLVHKMEEGPKYVWYYLKGRAETNILEQCLENAKTKEIFIFSEQFLEYPEWVCLNVKEHSVEYVCTLSDYTRRYQDFRIQLAKNTPTTRRMKEDEKVKIIVVDDMPDVRECIIDKINCEEYEFILEKDNPAGLSEDIKNLNPHLILMDVYMGDYNGIQEMKKLKADFTDVCYIIMSSSRHEDTPAMMAGANAFIHKEIEGGQMKSIIDYNIANMFRWPAKDS